MKKIPFDIKFRPEIESGKYKVRTANGFPVTIYRWDFKDREGTPIMGSYVFEDGNEYCAAWSETGMFHDKPDNLDLFILTDEPELSEFEVALKGIINDAFYCVDYGDENVKRNAKTLFDLARKQLCKGCAANLEGYIKGREDARKEMEENRVYKHEGHTLPTYYPCCPNGGSCINPFRDCINCPRQSSTGINTTTGTSTSKLDG